MSSDRMMMTLGRGAAAALDAAMDAAMARAPVVVRNFGKRMGKISRFWPSTLQA